MNFFFPSRSQQQPMQQAPIQGPAQTPMITERQDEAYQKLMAGLAGPAPASDDRWGNAQHALQQGFGYWAGLDDLNKAKAADMKAQRQQQSIAQLLMQNNGGGFY